jgi:hypothetical protein
MLEDYDDTEMELWHYDMEELSTNSIKNDELEYLKINKVLVNPSLGICTPARGLEGIK